MTKAIAVEGVSKTFRLYHDKNQTLKATVMRGRRARYEEFTALHDVSLDIEAGSTYGFIGHNGSGKSTLLKCIAKILRPDAGRITADGKISALLELGAGFHPELSGRENIYLNGAILGIPNKAIAKKYDDIVEFAGLEQFIDTPVKNYSSGMYVRLGFSVAINVDPDILLIDEVLAVGDEEFQRKCNEKFADLRAHDKTIVVVSHGLGVMRNMCDEIAWMDHGNLRMSGEAAQVVDAYIAAVQDASVVDEAEGSARWGSGEMRIEHIEVLSPDGTTASKVHTGDPVRLRLHYHALEPVVGPVIQLSIHTLERTLVSSPNTRDAGVVLGTVSGKGSVDLTVDRLLLLPGPYQISTTVFDSRLAHSFDAWQNARRLDVDAGAVQETGGGLISLGGRWTASSTSDGLPDAANEDRPPVSG